MKGQRGKGGGGIGPEETLVATGFNANFSNQCAPSEGESGPLTSQAHEAGVCITPSVASPLEASDGHHGYSSPRGDGADNLIAEPVAVNLRGREEGARAEFSDAASLRAASGGSSRSHVGTEAAVRRLTPVECERLQGFPDDWTNPTGNEPDSRRYAALGDAVTVNVAHWIGLRIGAAEA